ncbi:MAG: nucleotidyltransferase domain-containing protein [Mycolicibacterium frederiksbergense]|nr:nucleotidyltransferase domain-containing protein [Mycolicibacterium frederiksbergense]
MDYTNTGADSTKIGSPATDYVLPFGTEFATRHSTAGCRDIAQSGLILLSEIGSTMHGVSSVDTGDDLDLMGICIEPPTESLGLGDFEQYEYRDRKVNERSQEGDTDLVVYGLRKWVKLAATGNPTVIMPLFSDPDLHIKQINATGLLVRSDFPKFLSQQAGHRFLGYLDGQLQRYLDPDRVDSKHATRPELVEKYGWDTKTGYHALRLAIQGKQLMDHAHIDLPMRAEDREFLLDVRHGRYTRDWVIEETHRRIDLLKTAIAQSRLPETADRDLISRWMANVQRVWWDENGL